MSISEVNIFPYNLMVFALFYRSITCMNAIPQLILFACYIRFSLQQIFSSSPETLQKFPTTFCTTKTG